MRPQRLKSLGLSGVIIILLALTACGFQPMYGQKSGSPAMSGSVSAELSAIRIYGIADRDGQSLRNQLLHTLNPYGEPASPRYGLAITLDSNFNYAAPNQEGYSTVTQNIMQAHYTLTNIANGVVLKTGKLRSFATARNLGPRYASIAAENDIKDRNISDLAQGLVGQLGAWFADPSHRVGQVIGSGSTTVAP